MRRGWREVGETPGAEAARVPRFPSAHAQGPRCLLPEPKDSPSSPRSQGDSPASPPSPDPKSLSLYYLPP